jgi:hypothetical protein
MTLFEIIIMIIIGVVLLGVILGIALDHGGVPEDYLWNG